MESLVVYDSNFGNTRRVAEAVAAALGSNTHAVQVDQVTPDMLIGLNLLVIGSPINAWRPTGKISAFLQTLKPSLFTTCQIATFDTRVSLFIHGDAAKNMTKLLTSMGATAAGEPAWFYVEGREGPLKAGELERAVAWTKTLTDQRASK